MFEERRFHLKELKYPEIGSLKYNKIKFLQAFYNSITLLSEISKKESSVSRKILKELKINYKTMQSIPMVDKDPLESKLRIVEAVLSQLEGDFKKSVQLLDQVIELCDRRHCYSDKILACELAASFCTSNGFTDVANNYLHDAEKTSTYEKVDIDRKQKSSTLEYEESNNSIDTTLEAIDLSTVIHSSHIISSEIILERLFEQLLKILMANAGATKTLIILNKNNELSVVAIGSPKKNEILEKPISVESFEHIPLSIINFIKRSYETVVLNNANRNGMFTSDPYIVKNKTKSILSYPLLMQSELRGIVYLENDLTVDAFLPQRVELIKLISNQAAISIENALLFEKERDIEMQLQEQFEEIQAQYEEMESMNEEVIKSSEELFEANKSLAIFQKFTNESAQGMAITDVHGKITYGNLVFARMFGEDDANAVPGKDLSLLYADREQQDIFKSIMKEVLSGKKWVGELEIKTHDGSLIPVIQSCFAIKDELGNPQYLATIIADMSKQKRLEEQLLQSQKMEAIGTLAGGIAHDFNNLLTVILGYSELVLKEMDPSNKFSPNINEIYNAAKKSSSMINQLLAYSKKQILQRKILEINHLVADMIQMLARVIGENINLETFLMEDLLKINADPGQIEQVIMNLVVNARDAMNDGGAIVITTGNKIITKENVDKIPNAKEGTYICLSIEDDGSGMDQETTEKIFDPFFTTKDQGKGTGLGLSVVYGIIAQHNGWINVESIEGKGTAFHIYIPTVEDGNIKEKRNGVKIDIASKQGKGQKILLIEDQPEVIRFVDKALSNHGYSVFQATNGQEAKKIFKENKGEFGMIFSDVVLPDTSGFKLVDFFRAYSPDLPIILSSGYSKEMSQWEKIQEKGIYFIEKPYVLSKLLNLISEIFDKN